MLGFFDSGYGGLTVLKACRQKLSQFNYLYLGDNKRAPYGQRSSEEIYQFTLEGVGFLFERGATLIILACNTASAAALRKLQQEWLPQNAPDKRILGVLVPTIEQITGLPWNAQQTRVSVASEKGVGILATEATVKTGTYPLEIEKRAPSLPVYQQACPGLVEAIEKGDEGAQRNLIQQFVPELLAQGEISACVLGCTHYELLAEAIADVLPGGVELYRQPEIVAESLKHYCGRHPELAPQKYGQGKLTLFTTGNVAEVNQHAKDYFGEDVSFLTV